MRTLLRRGRPDGGADPARLQHPALAADVLLHEPTSADGSWFLQRGGRQYFAVTADLARLVAALDGVRDSEALAQELGPPWRPVDVRSAVATLAKAELIDDGRGGRRPRGGWIRFVPPLTLQFKVLNPARPLARMAPLIRVMGHKVVLIAGAAIALLGLLELTVRGGDVTQALGRPLPMSTYLLVALATLATTMAHEVAHGATLTFHGGRPSRMGFMLFYLAPAFFCDVSDGWRLPHKRQRVQVALAGIATQFVVAGAAASLSGLIPNPELRDAAYVFAVVTYVAGLLNLVPFVKLDGYIALMCHVNVSHLRDKALMDARRFIARVLFGGRPTPVLPEISWSVPFGLACMIFPVYLIAQAMVLWVDVFARLGLVGTGLLLAAAGYLAYHVGRGVVRVVREGRAAGARWWRVCAGLGVVAAAAAALLTLVRIPVVISGGYLVDHNGQMVLVLPEGADPARLEAGAQVRLYRSGLVTRTRTGSATLRSTEPSSGSAPVSAFVPLRVDGVALPAQHYPLDPVATPAEAVGMAQVEAGTLPLGAWLYATYVAPVVSR